MSAAEPSDPYETGHSWDVETFAAQWRVDPSSLRQALNVTAFGLEMPLGHATPSQRRDDLLRIASAANAFASALDALVGALAGASDDTTVFFLSSNVPAQLRADLLLRPSMHRKAAAKQMRALAESAVERARTLGERASRGAECIKVTRKPQRRLPTPQERQIATGPALLWWRNHGEWPNVSDRKTGPARGQKGNEGGRFVIAGVKKFFDTMLTDQRLRTALKSIQRPAET
jgi:hypothetical protein